MRNNAVTKKIIAATLSLFIMCSTASVRPAMCGTLTVQEQEPKYKYVTKPTESMFIQKTESVDKLVSNVTAGVVQGVDTNPLMDSSHKADNYTQELVDMHFKYPILSTLLGFTSSNFGFNAVNTNYYTQTDVNTMDAIGDINIEQEIIDKITVSAGYVFEYMWFPRTADGTFIGNQFNACIKQDLTSWTYQKAAYRVILRDYPSNRARLGDFSQSSYDRFDVRNQFEHELGVYAGSKTKFRFTNQFYINDSNEQYFDYYDYYNYVFGTTLTRAITKKLYNVTGFYYQRRNYMARQVSDGTAIEKDNYYLVTTSFLYDITKDISIFVNYSYSQNNSNSPLEQYVDNMYSTGLYYSF